MLVRSWHTYIGMLIAPAVLFMAATGILQIYGLHEARGDYTPPPLIEKLGRLHKDQVFAAAHKRPAAKTPAAGKPADAEAHGGGDRRGGDATQHQAPPAPKVATVLLKAFLAAVAVGLIGSTLAGLWMALRQPKVWRLHLLLLVIGAVIPTVLAALST
jgi:hypothetical protein